MLYPFIVAKLLAILGLGFRVWGSGFSLRVQGSVPLSQG